MKLTVEEIERFVKEHRQNYPLLTKFLKRITNEKKLPSTTAIIREWELSPKKWWEFWI